MPQSTKPIAANIWKKAQKVILGFLLAGGVLLCASVLALSLYVPFLVKKQLEKQVAKSSAQQWQLSIEAVNIYWLRFSFALEGLELTKSNKFTDILPAQDSTRDWRIQIRRIECSGISLWEFLRNDTLRINSLKIQKAKLYGGLRYSEKSDQEIAPIPWQEKLQAAIQGITPLLYIGELAIEEVEWGLQIQQVQGIQKHHCQYFYARVAPLAIGSSFFFDSLRLHLSHYEGRLASGAVLGLQALSFQSQEAALSLSKFYWQQSPTQKITLEALDIEQWAWQEFLQSPVLEMASLRVYRPDIWWLLPRGKSPRQGESLWEALLQSEALPELQVACKSIALEEASLHLWQAAELQSQQHSLATLHLQIQDFKLNSRKALPEERLWIEALELEAAGYRWTTPEQSLALDSLYYNSQEQYCRLNVLAWQQPGLQVKLQEALAQKLDLAALWYERGLILGEWQLHKPEVRLQASLPKNKGKEAAPRSEGLRYYDLAALKVQEADFFWQKEDESLALQNASFKLDRLYAKAPFQWQMLPRQIALQLQNLQVASGSYQQKEKDTEIRLEALDFLPRQYLKAQTLQWQQGQQSALLAAPALEGLDWAAYWQERKLYLRKFSVVSLQMVLALAEEGEALLPPDTLEAAEYSPPDSLWAMGPVRRFEQQLEQLLQSFVEELYVDTFLLQGLQIAIKGKEKSPSHEIEQGEMRIVGAGLSSRAVESDSLPLRRFLLENASLHLQNYQFTAPQGQFSLQVEELHLDKEKRHCLLKGLQYQDQAGNTCTVPDFYIENIDWPGYWENQYLHLGLLALPEASVHLQGKATAKQETDASPLLPLHFREMLAQKAKKMVAQVALGFAIDSVLLQKTKLSFEIREGNTTIQRHQIDSLGLLITDFRIDSSTEVGALERFLFAEKSQMALRKYSFRKESQALLLENEYLYWDSRDSSLRAEGLRLRKGEQLDLQAPAFVLSHISLRDYLAEQNLKVADILIESPSFRYFYDKTRISVLAKPKLKTPPEDSVLVWQRQLQALIPNVARAIHIDRLLLQGGSLQYAQQGYKGLLRQSLEYIDLQVMDIHLDSSALQAPQALFVADRAALRFRNYTLVQPDSMYQLQIAAGAIDTKKRQAVLSAVHYRPLLAEEQVIRSKPSYKSRLNAHAESIRLQQIDFAMLLKRSRLVVQKVHVEDMLLSVSDDDRIAGNPKHLRVMPNELFRALPFYLRIDTVMVESSRIVYKENILGGRGEGELTFEEFETRAYELSNDSLIPYSNLWAKAKFMNEGLLTLKLRIPLTAEDFQMDFEGNLGAMDAILINRMIESNAHVNLKRGQVKRISFEGSLANYVAQGKMLAVYRGFKVRVLKRESYKKRGLISFLANLLLNQTNKRKQGQIEYYRSGTDGFMKLLWRSVGSGLKDTLLPAIVKRRL
jgi:hypothetical protein